MALLHIEDPKRRAPPSFALWALGFRPFYLLGALFAALALPVWVMVLSGKLEMPMPGLWWHAHEMLFGFAVAVITGFLYTAGRNWTGLQTPDGKALAALAALWLAGRIAMASSAGALAATVDVLFLPAATFGLARVLVKAKSTRNYVMVGILSALSLSNLGFHLARLGVIALDPLPPLHFALGLIVLLETLMGGRVIPMFTVNGLRGVRKEPLQPWQPQWLERAAIGATGLALLLWVLGGGAWAGVVSLAAGGLQLARCLGWKPWTTFRVPLVWILHLGHLWIPLGLLLLAATQWEWLPRAAALHAFGIGSTGGLIIGMITRTALGHTGRMLIAGRVETTAYVCVQLAALVRVGSVVAAPALVKGAIHLAATLWATAFLLYFIRYLPWLTRSRPDGKPG